jgi:hypothetical protein
MGRETGTCTVVMPGPRRTLKVPDTAPGMTVLIPGSCSAPGYEAAARVGRAAAGRGYAEKDKVLLEHSKSSILHYFRS